MKQLQAMMTKRLQTISIIGVPSISQRTEIGAPWAKAKGTETAEKLSPPNHDTQNPSSRRALSTYRFGNTPHSLKQHPHKAKTGQTQ